MNQEELFRVLRGFARTMAGGYDTTHVLHDLSESVVDVLGVTAVGVALLDGPELRFVTATNEVGARAEHVQEQLQSGPCLASIRENHPVRIADICEHDDRWPDYAPRVAELGLRGVLGIPLVLDERQVGSLDIYSAEPRHWDDEVVEAALALADIGAAYVLNASDRERTERTAQQLQTALDTRVVIEQAKGMLAERLGITPQEAFEQIRASARRHSATVVETSRRVIDTGYVPD